MLHANNAGLVVLKHPNLKLFTWFDMIYTDLSDSNLSYAGLYSTNYRSLISCKFITFSCSFIMYAQNYAMLSVRFGFYLLGIHLGKSQNCYK